MTTISSRVVEYSKSPELVELASLVLRYPRFIHAELMTHRVLSRSASSSRAIPVRRLISQVIEDPAEPVAWGFNRSGMQAGEELTGWRLWLVRLAWFSAMWCAIVFAWIAMKAGAHKQIVNRILEPWSHITVIVTATDWDNFLALRDHPDADPTIRALAREIEFSLRHALPQYLSYDDWHLPFISDTERQEFSIQVLRRASAARCARVSFLNHDGTQANLEKDLKLFNKLMGGDPKHVSPVEHQAKPDKILAFGLLDRPIWTEPSLHGNLRGWIQHRKLIPGEAAPESNLPDTPSRVS